MLSIASPITTPADPPGSPKAAAWAMTVVPSPADTARCACGLAFDLHAPFPPRARPTGAAGAGFNRAGSTPIWVRNLSWYRK
jgi:hypothetical protein